jgi:hypothetical protein
MTPGSCLMTQRFVPNDTSFVLNDARSVSNDAKFVPNDARFVSNDTSFVPNEARFVLNEPKLVRSFNKPSHLREKWKLRWHTERVIKTGQPPTLSSLSVQHSATLIPAILTGTFNLTVSLQKSNSVGAVTTPRVGPQRIRATIGGRNNRFYLFWRAARPVWSYYMCIGSKAAGAWSWLLTTI